MTTIYSHALRVLACTKCGAPFVTDPAGGRVDCGYCGTPHRLVPRDEAADRARARARPVMSESERLARLREQAERDEPLPASIAALLDHQGRLAREKAAGLVPEWGEARRAVETRGDFPSSERLFHLTRLLLPHLDHERRRALLETALELSSDPRHRHVLACELALGAARVGELDAARAWLELVEPRPADLLMDSAVRAAIATLAVAEGRGEVVLAELAERRGDVPCTPSYAAAHDLLRVSGLELVGRLDEAIAMLEKLSPAAVGEAVAAFAPMAVAASARRELDRRRSRARLGHLRARLDHLEEQAVAAMSHALSVPIILLHALAVDALVVPPVIAGLLRVGQEGLAVGAGVVASVLTALAVGVIAHQATAARVAFAARVSPALAAARADCPLPREEIARLEEERAKFARPWLRDRAGYLGRRLALMFCGLTASLSLTLAAGLGRGAHDELWCPAICADCHGPMWTAPWGWRYCTRIEGHLDALAPRQRAAALAPYRVTDRALALSVLGSALAIASVLSLAWAAGFAYLGHRARALHRAYLAERLAWARRARARPA
ncbi:MAG: hypothetical protein KF729_35445 [Sandaracinaceae bacterium]|nr:hypothetical protein [Sandaracinaceae bacterium]